MQPQIIQTAKRENGIEIFLLKFFPSTHGELKPKYYASYTKNFSNLNFHDMKQFTKIQAQKRFAKLLTTKMNFK